MVMVAVGVVAGLAAVGVMAVVVSLVVVVVLLVPFRDDNPCRSGTQTFTKSDSIWTKSCLQPRLLRDASLYKKRPDPDPVL